MDNSILGYRFWNKFLMLPNCDFTDTNPGIIKNLNIIKTVFTIKARKKKITALTIISHLNKIMKSDIRVEHNYMK